jgi:3-deoxy-D-manno-octulosonic-acid transferase
MVRWLYSFLVWLITPLMRRKLRLRAKAEPGYAEAVPERWGYYTTPPMPPAGPGTPPTVWVHAVSLGETRAAAVLVAQLRLQWPGMRLLLTHGTATGREQGRALLQPGDVQVWQPWDTLGGVKRFLVHFKPHAGLLVETEVWPNMVAACQQSGVPLCLVNARLNEKSLRQAQRMAWLARPAYRGLRAVWAQTPQDAQRLATLGADVHGVLGNFKFDVQPDCAQLDQGGAWRQAHAKPVIMFASSREGEEAMLLDKLKQIRALALVERAQAATNLIANGVQWLIVPRHPQRFDAVERLCRDAGFSVGRRSRWQDGPEAADIWLGDTLGEMALYFGLADAALLGGSFAPLGGQNLIEAAACDCPVFMGPHTFNFAQAAELAQEAGAAFEVKDLAQAVDRAMALVQDDAALQQAGDAARSLGQANRGAALRTAQAVRAVVG